MKVASLYRYPVKGLSPEPMGGAALEPGRCLPWDRAFALAQGDATFDPASPSWVPKSQFMCLLRNAGIARLHSRYDERTGFLTVTTPAGEVFSASAHTEDGKASLTRFFTDYLGPEARLGAQGQAPQFQHVPAHSFCDHQTQVISFIGLGSLRSLEAAVGAPRDARRFRANIYVEDIEPWAEFDWMGRTLRIGSAALLVQDRIDRCGATSVNPDTAVRDANPVKELQQNFGHIELGVFATVIEGGEICVGDEIQVS